jgi:hypothetical protein
MVKAPRALYHMGKYSGEEGRPMDECNHGAIEERAKGHERILDDHERRLNDHEKRIRNEEQHSGVIDESVRNVCRRVDGLTKALWAVAAAVGSAAFAYFFDLLAK